MTLAQQFRQEGHLEGRQEGRQEGKLNLIHRQLARKFPGQDSRLLTTHYSLTTDYFLTPPFVQLSNAP
jgi:hypothetical protein